MSQTFFSIAKYIADRQRMEPRNIGVITWCNGLVSARFAGERGAVVKPPKFIEKHARQSYQKIIESWRLQCKKKVLPVGRGQDDVLHTSPEFLDALSGYSQEHFVIVSGGHCTEYKSEGTEVLDYLFSSMVDDVNDDEKPKKSALVEKCDTILAPLDDGRLQRNFGVPSIAMEREFPFTYGLGDQQHPEYLLQIVSLSSDDQIDSTAMKFRCLVEDFTIPKSHCACLIDDHGSDSKTIRDRITYLSRYSEIVSVANETTARLHLNRMGLPV